jgi:hypothetical protein
MYIFIPIILIMGDENKLKLSTKFKLAASGMEVISEKCFHSTLPLGCHLCGNP